MPGDEMRRISENPAPVFPLAALIATTTVCCRLLIHSHINRVAGRHLFSLSAACCCMCGFISVPILSALLFFFSPAVSHSPHGVAQLVHLEPTFAEEQLARINLSTVMRRPEKCLRRWFPAACVSPVISITWDAVRFVNPALGE